jgi:hypothetical protein
MNQGTMSEASERRWSRQKHFLRGELAKDHVRGKTCGGQVRRRHWANEPRLSDMPRFACITCSSADVWPDINWKDKPGKIRAIGGPTASPD